MKIVHFNIYLNDILCGRFHLLQCVNNECDIYNRINLPLNKNKKKSTSYNKYYVMSTEQDILNGQVHLLEYENKKCNIYNRINLPSNNINKSTLNSKYYVISTQETRCQVDLKNEYKDYHLREKKVVGKKTIMELSKQLSTILNDVSKELSHDNKPVSLQNVETLENCYCLSVIADVRKQITVNISESFLSAFYKTLSSSRSYRIYILNKVYDIGKYSETDGNFYSVVNLALTSFKSVNVIDYKWSEILQRLCTEKKELNRAMSWLSTIGGACSALGDENKYFASKAALISVEQFRLALKLGDELTVCRCKLYYALSLIQRGAFRTANKIINEQYNFAINNRVGDEKLLAMCLGIRKKLQYEYNKSKCSRKNPRKRLR